MKGESAAVHTWQKPRSRLLLVDDTPSNLDTLIAILEGEYDLAVATSGPQALELLQRGRLPDLILLDVMMPGMDGYEVCAALRRDPATREIPVIFVTARSDAASESEALTAGAVDFIHKPVNLDVIRARVRLHLELQRRTDELADARRREASIAAAIQQRLLVRAPPAVAGYSLGSFTTPARSVSGDFHTFTPIEPGRFEILVADVMGKGATAALLGSAVKGAYWRVWFEQMVALGGREEPSPAAIVNALSASIAPELIELESFVTLSLMRFDYHARTVTWVDAGHTPTLHATGGRAQAERLAGDNLPLGVLDGERFEQHVTAFAPGDVFLLYSDGVSEASDAQGEEFGEGRLEQELVDGQRANASAPDLVAALSARVRAHAGDGPAHDDRTLVVVRIEDAA